jgi:hypothetical protein
MFDTLTALGGGLAKCLKASTICSAPFAMACQYFVVFFCSLPLLCIYTHPPTNFFVGFELGLMMSWGLL